MDKNAPYHADLRRFRTKAAERLQLAEPSRHPKEPRQDAHPAQKERGPFFF
jgi:hypothetical protein